MVHLPASKAPLCTYHTVASSRSDYTRTRMALEGAFWMDSRTGRIC